MSYWDFASCPLNLLLGPTATAIGIVALSLYGAAAFADRGTISQIDFVQEGEFVGCLRLKVAKSPFFSYTIIAKLKDTRSVCAVGNDDLGADDVEGNVLEVAEYIDEATGEKRTDGVFVLPADANRSK